MEGQRIVIIGGTSGFGMATAKAASAEGASVVVASSKRTNVDRALDELPASAEGHVLDITQESAMTDFFSTIGEFDHLAVTAGESLDLGEFATVDLEKARRFFEVRFWGAVTAAKYAAKRIRSTGSIILTNGIIGLRPQKGWVIAAGICGAVEAVTRALAIDRAPVRVNLVCAGIVRLPLKGACDHSLFRKIVMRLIKGSLVGPVLAGILAIMPAAVFAHGGGGGGDHGGGLTE